MIALNPISKTFLNSKLLRFIRARSRVDCRATLSELGENKRPLLPRSTRQSTATGPIVRQGVKEKP